MKRILSFLPLLMMASGIFSGCCQKTYPTGTIVHDTVTVTREVRLRDTAIVIPGAAISTSLNDPHDSPRRLGHREKVLRNLRNRQTHLKVTQSANGLTIDCNCDTMAIRAQLRDSLIEVSHQRQEVKTEVVVKKYVPLVVKILAWMGGICSFVLLAYLTKKFWLK